MLALSIAIASFNSAPSDDFDKDIREQAQVFSKKLWVYSELHHKMIYHLLYEMDRLLWDKNKQNIIDELFKGAACPEESYTLLKQQIHNSLWVLANYQYALEYLSMRKTEIHDAEINCIMIGIFLLTGTLTACSLLPVLLIPITTFMGNVLGGFAISGLLCSFIGIGYNTVKGLCHLFELDALKKDAKHVVENAKVTLTHLHAPPNTYTQPTLSNKQSFFKDEFPLALRIQGLNYHKQNHEPHRRDSWSSSVRPGV